MRVRGAPLLMALAFAATGLVAGPVAQVVPASAALAAGSFADPHFREVPVFGGLVNPISVRFATDGRAFVAEKRGTVKAFDSIDDTTPTTVVDLQTPVMNYWDRGLLGLALDPAFLAQGAAARPYLYLYYVYDAPPGATAPVWHDACPGSPNGPGATTDGCVARGRAACGASAGGGAGRAVSRSRAAI